MTLKINFCDFWPGFEKNNLLLKFLEDHYVVTIDDKPDYLFYSVYGTKHLYYTNCIKILYTGENIVPDFNLCDYALGFHYMEFGDRYLRFPLYAYYQWHYSDRLKGKSNYNYNTSTPDDVLKKRKFCNFVYSNNVNSDPARDLFFQKLNQYKKVDSGGRHLNNIGKPVADKLQFIKGYKFTIAFENSSVPGYTTEKLLEPIIAESLPIYYGNPLVHLDFNTGSFVDVKSISDFDRAIDEITLLDTNDDIYLEKLKQDKFNADNRPEIWEEKLLRFLNSVFGQTIPSAHRKPIYGFNKFYSEELKFQADLLIEKRKNNYQRARVKTLVKKYLPGILGK